MTADDDAADPVARSGSTLVVGPSGAGKTRWTARALLEWVGREGEEGVVVLEFAPELERDGRLLGGRLDRFVDLPAGAWVGVLDAHAPRAESEDETGARTLASENATRAADLLAAAPEPRAVFVDDATIPLQAPGVGVDALLDYCDRAEVAVLNAFDGEELGVTDAVSRRERRALATLRGWADRVLELE